jgi:hypothetical protein
MTSESSRARWGSAEASQPWIWDWVTSEDVDLDARLTRLLRTYYGLGWGVGGQHGISSLEPKPVRVTNKTERGRAADVADGQVDRLAPPPVPPRSTTGLPRQAATSSWQRITGEAYNTASNPAKPAGSPTAQLVRQAAHEEQRCGERQKGRGCLRRTEQDAHGGR